MDSRCWGRAALRWRENPVDQRVVETGEIVALPVAACAERDHGIEQACRSQNAAGEVGDRSSGAAARAPPRLPPDRRSRPRRRCRPAGPRRPPGRPGLREWSRTRPASRRGRSCRRESRARRGSGPGRPRSGRWVLRTSPPGRPDAGRTRNRSRRRNCRPRRAAPRTSELVRRWLQQPPATRHIHRQQVVDARPCAAQPIARHQGRRSQSRTSSAPGRREAECRVFGRRRARWRLLDPGAAPFG